MRILVVSAEAFAGFESRNLRVARELIERGHDAVHTGPSTEMLARDFSLTTFDPAFAETEEAGRANTRLFSSWDGLADMIDRSQVVLFGIGKSYDTIVDYAHKEGKVILWHWDVGADHLWIKHVDRMAVRGRFEAAATAAALSLRRENIEITGCVQFDLAAPENQRLDRTTFCRKYGLDERKRTAVFLSNAPASHAENVKANYRLICAAVRAVPDFNLIIKPHPREFARSKQGTTYADTDTPTWQQLAPGVPACEAADTYDCYRHCDVLLTQNSGSYREAALFRKPMLEVNIPEFCAHRFYIKVAELARYLPEHRFTPVQRRRWTWWGCLESVYDDLPAGPFKNSVRQYIDEFHAFYPLGGPDYIGSECSVAELGEILRNGAYAFDDAKVYDDYVSEYCFANDGRAYQRVAQMVANVERDPVLSAKLRDPLGMRRLRSVAKRSLRKWRSRHERG